MINRMSYMHTRPPIHAIRQGEFMVLKDPVSSDARPPTHPAKDPVHSVEIAAPSENHLASVSGNQTSLSDFPLDATVDLDASETLAHTNTRIRT